MSDGTEILVMFLTDVEGSTALWQGRRKEMLRTLDHLDAVVERVIGSHGGALDKERGEGDSHFALFKQATSATRAAAELQRELAAGPWPQGVALKVRIGLHVGELHRRGRDYAGVAISYAARLRSVAHGGQVVASRTLVELVADELDAGLRWQSLGRHRVRDLAGWTEIFQLYGPGLIERFPPLATLDAGAPPLAAVVMIDAMDTLGATDNLNEPDADALLGSFSTIFASCFTKSRGQHLSFLGDGCMAVFADPEAALTFLREVRERVRTLGLDTRSGLHIGRVCFDVGGPYGRAIGVSWKLMRSCAPGKTLLSPAAAAVLAAADDLGIAPDPAV
ncbi:MAG TPA: adenylate/guanylate cyclase domain-containing protein [Polyangiales bacterium]|nr:adenylate/guanylate cyclase domain-containing protein [Polyangiales bacterium]